MTPGTSASRCLFFMYMSSSSSATTAAPAPGFVLPVVAAVGLSHLLNDLIQALLPAIYPMLKTQFALSFGQIGRKGIRYQKKA